LRICEDKDGVSQFRILSYRLEALLAVFLTLGFVARTATGTVFLDWVDEFVVVQDLGTWEEWLEVFGYGEFGYGEFAYAGEAVDVD
jgi:hypothetical protein